MPGRISSAGWQPRYLIRYSVPLCGSINHPLVTFLWLIVSQLVDVSVIMAFRVPSPRMRPPLPQF